MKKCVAILLLGIFLFNLIGYQFLYSFLENRANRELEFRLNNNDYNEDQLIAIRVPVEHLAYYSNSSQYQRVNGEVEINGVRYHYVKRRLYNDSLELLCLPNHEAMRLQSAKDEFFQLVSDLDHAGQNKKTDSDNNSSKNISTDYLATDDLSVPEALVSLRKNKMHEYAAPVNSCYLSSIEQPPRHC